MSKTLVETTAVALMRGPVGVVSVRSPLSALVTRPALTIEADATLGAAAAAMETAGVSALVVGDLVGIVTERDITRAFAHGVAPDEPVTVAATPHPIVVAGTMTVLEAAAFMLNEHVRHLIVRTADGFVVASLRDVAAVLLQSAQPEIWLAAMRRSIEAPTETWLG